MLIQFFQPPSLIYVGNNPIIQDNFFSWVDSWLTLPRIWQSSIFKIKVYQFYAINMFLPIFFGMIKVKALDVWQTNLSHATEVFNGWAFIVQTSNEIIQAAIEPCV